MVWKGCGKALSSPFMAKVEAVRCCCFWISESYNHMATAGYSGTPLLKKLGIKESMKVQLVQAPDDYLQILQQDIRHQLTNGNPAPDLVHLFASSFREFEPAMKKLRPAIKANPNIVIWVSWYKKSAGIPTDLTEDVIRNWALQNNLVDVKVCAVTELWSGLKLVVPVSKRK